MDCAGDPWLLELFIMLLVVDLGLFRACCGLRAPKELQGLGFLGFGNAPKSSINPELSETCNGPTL